MFYTKGNSSDPKRRAVWEQALRPLRSHTIDLQHATRARSEVADHDATSLEPQGHNFAPNARRIHQDIDLRGPSDEDLPEFIDNDVNRIAY
jgi:hypothetical protein